MRQFKAHPDANADAEPAFPARALDERSRDPWGREMMTSSPLAERTEGLGIRTLVEDGSGEHSSFWREVCSRRGRLSKEKLCAALASRPVLTPVRPSPTSSLSSELAPPA